VNPLWVANLNRYAALYGDDEEEEAISTKPREYFDRFD
jgi:hypothetical protein